MILCFCAVIDSRAKAVCPHLWAPKGLIYEHPSQCGFQEYIDFAKTLKGGRKSALRAKCDWDAMAANKKDHIHDYDGPEDQALRFAVAVRDVVTFRDAHKRAKACGGLSLWL